MRRTSSLVRHACRQAGWCLPAKVVVAGVSAMVSLRGRLRRPWQSPVFTCFLGIASSLMLLAMTAHSFAQSTQKAPHEANAVETGVITGTLLKDGKSPLGGHIVTLEILNGHQLILTLPKQTDTKGSYQFKNIFQSPEFSYAVSTEFEGKTYRTNFVSLKEGEKSKKLDIAVGSSAKEGPPLPPPMNGEEIFPSPLVGEGRGEGELHRSIAHSEYKLLAILLSIAAIGYAVYQRKRA